MKNTLDIVASLDPTQRILVGTNLAGSHGGGLAREASVKWGLLPGVSEGLVGQCYAFPTLSEDLDQLARWQLELYRDRFYACAEANPGLTFLLTKVGCGIAGYPEKDMKSLFVDAPSNVVKPHGW